MGIESAALLSDLIGRARHSSEIPELLRLYNQAQRPRAKTVSARSRMMGDVLEMIDGPAQIQRDSQLCHDIPKPGFPFAWSDPKLQAFLWDYDTKSEAASLWETHVSSNQGREAALRKC